jgi:hypothetical protein
MAMARTLCAPLPASNPCHPPPATYVSIEPRSRRVSLETLGYPPDLGLRMPGEQRLQIGKDAIQSKVILLIHDIHRGTA